MIGGDPPFETRGRRRKFGTGAGRIVNLQKISNF